MAKFSLEFGFKLKFQTEAQKKKVKKNNCKRKNVKGIMTVIAYSLLFSVLLATVLDLFAGTSIGVWYFRNWGIIEPITYILGMVVYLVNNL
jgi:hypothetical protein